MLRILGGRTEILSFRCLRSFSWVLFFPEKSKMPHLKTPRGESIAVVLCLQTKKSPEQNLKDPKSRLKENLL